MGSVEMDPMLFLCICRISETDYHHFIVLFLNFTKFFLRYSLFPEFARNARFLISKITETRLLDSKTKRIKFIISSGLFRRENSTGRYSQGPIPHTSIHSLNSGISSLF